MRKIFAILVLVLAATQAACRTVSGDEFRRFMDTGHAYRIITNNTNLVCVVTNTTGGVLGVVSSGDDLPVRQPLGVGGIVIARCGHSINADGVLVDPVGKQTFQVYARQPVCRRVAPNRENCYYPTGSNQPDDWTIDNLQPIRVYKDIPDILDNILDLLL
jgi:hypothetical protein